jgi:hypothetical protein
MCVAHDGLRFGQLDDPAGALASLDASAADAPAAPLEERALALRARGLERAGRRAEAQAVARRHLDRFPDAGMAGWMRALVGEP